MTTSAVYDLGEFDSCLVLPGIPVIPAKAGNHCVYLNVVWGVAGLVSASGLWMLKRWSMWLTIGLCVLGILSAAPGIGGAPTALLQILATTGVVGSALIIMLVALPNSRRAYV